MGLIRVFLALSVVIWHAPGQHVRLLNAAVAVLCFFIISGFYMAMVVNEKYGPTGEGWIGRFYAARFLRLYPAYVAMCVVMVIWYWYTRNPNAFTSRLPVPVIEQVLLASINIVVIGQDLYELMNHIGGEGVRHLFSPGFFNGGWMLVGQAWSLSSEIFFYLLVPLVVRSPARTIALLVASFAVRALLIGGLNWESGVWGYWFIPATMCMFTLGCVSYRLYRAINGLVWSIPLGWCALGLMAGWLGWHASVYGIVLPVDASDNLDQPRFWLAYLIFAAAIPFVFAATKGIAADRMIGELSYPLYLAHGLMLGILFNRWGVSSESFSGLALGVFASFLAALALRMIEIAIEKALAWRPAAKRRLGFQP